MMSHRCGLFFAAGQGASLSVFVLPKPWALGEGALLTGGCVVHKTVTQEVIPHPPPFSTSAVGP
jgi:hypothetical protein